MGEETAPADEVTPETPGTGEALCPQCGGSGLDNGAPCEACDGTGKIVQGVGGA